MIIKKAVAVLLAILILSTSAVYAEAAGIRDLDKASDYARAHVEYLAETGILSGDENGNVNPMKTMTRGEAVAMIVRTLRYMGIQAGKLPTTATFRDVPAGSWAFPYVETAYMAGIVKGITADKFGLNELCTREQMAALFVRAFDASGLDTDGSAIENINLLKDSSEISSWAKNDVQLALKSGLMKGTAYNTFNPKAYAPKEQAAVIIDRFLGRREQTPEVASVPVSTDMGGPAIVFNGDVMALSHAPLVTNGTVLLPTDFFGRYFGPSESGAAAVDSDTASIHLAWGYNHLTSGYGNIYDTLWFKAGEKTAYKSGFIQQSPFKDPDTYAANALPLKITPAMVNGLLYLPLEDICTILGIQYNYDTASDTVTIRTDELPEYPQLRAALNDDYKVRSTGFRREAEASGTFSQTITGTIQQPDAQVSLGYGLNTKSNRLASQTSLEYILQQAGSAPQDLKYKKISAPILAVNDVTDSKPGDWLNIYGNYTQNFADVSRLTGLDPISTGKNVGVVTVGEKVVFNYKNLPVAKVVMVDLNGRKATKYVINLDGDDIMQVFSKNSSFNLFKGIYNQNCNYEINFYVVGQTLIRQEYHFSGVGKDEATQNQLKVTMDLAINYYNLGKQMPIELPNGLTVAPKA